MTVTAAATDEQTATHKQTPALNGTASATRVLSRLHVPAQYGKAATVLELCAPGTHVIGKYGKAVLVIDQDFVSGKHASIVIDDGEHWLVDLQSTNGTYFEHSANPIRPERFYQLTNGRRVRFGRTLAVYEIVSGPGARRPAAEVEGNVHVAQDATVDADARPESVHKRTPSIAASQSQRFNEAEPIATFADRMSPVVNDDDPEDGLDEQNATAAEHSSVEASAESAVRRPVSSHKRMRVEDDEDEVAVNAVDERMETEDLQVHHAAIVDTADKDMSAAESANPSQELAEYAGASSAPAPAMVVDSNPWIVASPEFTRADVVPAADNNDTFIATTASPIAQHHVALEIVPSPAFPSGKQLAKKKKVVREASALSTATTALSDDGNVSGPADATLCGSADASPGKSASKHGSTTVADESVVEHLPIIAETDHQASPLRPDLATASSTAPPIKTKKPAAPRNTATKSKVVVAAAEQEGVDNAAPVPKKAPARGARTKKAKLIEPAESEHAENEENAAPVQQEDNELMPPPPPRSRKAAPAQAKTNAPHPASTTVTANQDICVTLTGLDAKVEQKLKKLRINTVADWQKCTHLVTDKIRRTNKFLCALASGPADDYFLSDPDTEDKWQFSLAESRRRVIAAGPSSLMAGKRFMITPSTKPDFEDLKEIIEACGGTVIGDLPFRHDNDTLVVSCADDRDLLKQYTAWHEQVVSPEYVLTGALKQELDFAAYKLTKFGTTPMKIKQAASSQHASPIAAVVAPKRGGRAAAKKGGA